MRPRRFLSTVLTVVLAASVGCATRQPGDPLKPGYNVYSPEQDIQLGKEAAAEIRQQVDVVDNRALQDWVNRIGKQLAARPEAGTYPYEFTLINDDSINAFALPGGPIFAHTGLIDAADNEAEFAGVLAHEISHVALRHGTSQASKANIIQLPAVLAGAIIGQDSALAQLGQIGLGLGVNSVFMKYSREAEKEADALGTRIMAGAGYDPIAMATFFEKLAAEGGSGGPAFLSSHPNPGNRVENVRAEIQTFQTPAQYTAGTGEFPRMKQQTAQLPPPKKPQQAVANAAASSDGAPAPPPRGGFQRLQGRTFSVAYPNGWETFGNQQSSVLTIAPRQGLVRNAQGGASLGYGAVLSYYRPRSGRSNLQGATHELIGQLQQVNPALRVAGNARNVRVQGNPGMIVNLAGRSPYGGAERNVLLTVARPQGLFYMVFVAPEQGFNQLEPAFEEMLRSIQFRG
jgi:hypothetical protein